MQASQKNENRPRLAPWIHILLWADRIAAMERLQVQDPQPDELEASSLLDQLQSAELLLVEEMNPQIPKGSLQHVAWDDVGTLVTIPFWRSEVAKFGPLLLGKKAVSLPDLLKQLPQIGPRLPDPKGTLLTPKQRTERVAHLLGIAVSLILLEKGWKVHIQPAVLQFSRDGETLDAFGLVNDLLSCLCCVSYQKLIGHFVLFASNVLENEPTSPKQVPGTVVAALLTTRIMRQHPMEIFEPEDRTGFAQSAVYVN